jgi:hypothetical protein
MTSPYYEDWTESATCRSIGYEVFYPTLGETWAEPIRVCKTRCPVRLQCLDYAMRTELGVPAHHRAGVYGGLKPYQRVKYEAEWLASRSEAA